MSVSGRASKKKAQTLKTQRAPRSITVSKASYSSAIRKTPIKAGVRKLPRASQKKIEEEIKIGYDKSPKQCQSRTSPKNLKQKTLAKEVNKSSQGSSTLIIAKDLRKPVETSPYPSPFMTPQTPKEENVRVPKLPTSKPIKKTPKAVPKSKFKAKATAGSNK